ncbi:hypothetical protein HPB52_020630 [Rhipicephalus sanguineus]|uniref:DNA polymerase kappa n=1 Tax=Rhipicephalus sanguineus TaxID=34632 RepID=A0A9D4T0F9_RHISA|nr:hypothetical protein HPB52_020630 [Rhipicephalus sanguineus]
MDIIVEKMECTRDLNRVIVHVDMDAFYAAVEMLDNPSLRDKPMAVGSVGMLSTSNYEARKYGVRAAMPGFIGKKLCPTLVIVRPNFHKYTEFSRRVRQVLVQYDEDFTPVGLDEAYLDITEYMAKNDAEAEDVVQEMRQKIFDATQLTASAGIAANMFLAKVCSDMRKPNDQFRLPNDVDSIRKFVSSLPIRKVPGIGAVQEQLLMALGVRTCHDLWVKRAEIGHLFGEVTARFYLRAALGLGCTEVKCYEPNRKENHNQATLGTPDELLLASTPETLCANVVDKEDTECNMTTTMDSAKSVSSKEKASVVEEEEPASVECPVCGHNIRETDWSKVNEHIDTCLNKPMIREMLSSQDFASSPMPEKRFALSARDCHLLDLGL